MVGRNGIVERSIVGKVVMSEWLELKCNLWISSVLGVEVAAQKRQREGAYWVELVQRVLCSSVWVVLLMFVDA